MVKIPTIIPVQNFPKHENPGKLLSVCTSSDSSVNPSGSLSITLSPSAENSSKVASNHGENNTANYLHEILVKSPSIHPSCTMSVVAPICASSIPSVYPSDNECQEILDEFPCTNYGEKFPSEIMVKLPDDVTLTLH